jgi:TadE-like protein
MTAWARLRRALTWLARDDRGSLSVIAYAIAFPVIIALLAAFFQAALWFAARNTALSAAQQGVDTARRAGATLAQGEAAACGFASGVGGGMLRAATCAGSGGDTIAITVCGSAVQLIAFFPVHACEQAQGARERFTTPGQP